VFSARVRFVRLEQEVADALHQFVGSFEDDGVAAVDLGVVAAGDRFVEGAGVIDGDEMIMGAADDQRGRLDAAEPVSEVDAQAEVELPSGGGGEPGREDLVETLAAESV
jgi:hypothetical protein